MFEIFLRATGDSTMISILTSSPGTAFMVLINHVILLPDFINGASAETGNDMHIRTISVLRMTETSFL